MLIVLLFFRSYWKEEDPINDRPAVLCCMGVLLIAMLRVRWFYFAWPFAGVEQQQELLLSAEPFTSADAAPCTWASPFPGSMALPHVGQ